MLKLNNEFHIEELGGNKYIIHTKCKANVRPIRVILEEGSSHWNYCDDCQIMLPDELINKIKFIYSK